MATSVTIDASRLNDLLSQFDNAGPIVEREGYNALVRSAAQVQADAQTLAPVDTGTLRRSITTDVGPMQAAIGTNLPYAETMEVGRRPGAPMPPGGVLLGWMRRHGIPANREFIVRKNIGARGIRPQPYLVPSLEQNEPAIQREFDIAADRALAELMR